MKIFQQRCLSVVAIFFCCVFFAKNIQADSRLIDPHKIVYLTFDADMTQFMRQEQSAGLIKKWYDPALIEYLQNNNIAATFFVTGMFAEMYPDLIKSIANNKNFSIQNHTYDHKSFKPNCFHLPVVKSDKQKKVEIEKTQAIIKSLTGYTPTYFRYPGLCHNANDDILVRTEGLSLILNEIGSGDAYMKKPESIVTNVLRNLNRGQTIIIFHMGSKNTPQTTSAIKLLIPKLKKSEYIFGRL